MMSNKYRGNNKRGRGGRDHYNNETGPPLQLQQKYGNKPNPTEILVDTNQFELKIDTTNPVNQNTDTSEYIQYEVKIKNVHYKKIKDEVTGNVISSTFETKEIIDDHREKFEKKPFPWRIMKKFMYDNNVNVLAYDGSHRAYSRGDNGIVERREYIVRVKKDCEHDDPDAGSVGEKTFAIEFQQTKSFPFADVLSAFAARDSSLNEEIFTMVNVIVQSTLKVTSGMLSLETNSPESFFPLHMQNDLLRGKLLAKQRDDPEKTKMLLSGLGLNVVAYNGKVSVQTENVVKYANKEHKESTAQRHKTRVPLLNVGRHSVTIAGVQISDARTLVPNHSRRSIEEAIGKLGKVNVEYKGKDGRLYKNKFCGKDREKDSNGFDQGIVWNPHEYSFTYDGQETNIISYYKDVRGVKVQYPCMPLVYVDNITKRFGGGWFPIEFVFQAFAKSGENSDTMVQGVLRYKDNTAGKKYIEEAQMKLEKLSTLEHGDGIMNFEERLNLFGLQVVQRPVQQRAVILKGPTLRFDGSTVLPKNGSFNMLASPSRPRTFARPAEFKSVVVVDFTNNRDSCNDFVRRTMKATREHKIEIPGVIHDIINHDSDDEGLDQLSVHYGGNNAVDDALRVFQMAIQQAKNFYCYDTLHRYKRKHVFFETCCFDEQQEQYKCLVLPPATQDGKLGLLLSYDPGSLQRYCSHLVTTRDGSEHETRLMVKIKGTNKPVDPLNFRYVLVKIGIEYEGRHQARLGSSDEWVNVSFDSHCYKTYEGLVLEEIDIVSKEFIHLAENWEVDFPSLLLVYTPDDGKPLYDRTKAICNYLAGVQSQNSVMRKFEGQSNKDLYASNIAIKINTKLSTSSCKAENWTADKLPWIGERPTLLIAVAMAHGSGRFAKSAVAASVCLDSGCMRLAHSCFVQKKADKISGGVMKDIIQESIDSYIKDKNPDQPQPERILFYRDGISDGNFSIADDEIAMIREAAEEALEANVPITYVIAQNKVGLRMVPPMITYDSRQRPVNNVPPGTALKCSKNSFHLVAQYGGKGTSKPVKYIVYLNENAYAWGSYGLSMENLMACTNGMSSMYPSATKAVRELPVIKTAQKTANQALNSLNYLKEGQPWFGKYFKLVVPDDDTGTEEENRPYYTIQHSKDDVRWSYNLIQMPFRYHLGA